MSAENHGHEAYDRAESDGKERQGWKSGLDIIKGHSRLIADGGERSEPSELEDFDQSEVLERIDEISDSLTAADIERRREALEILQEYVEDSTEGLEPTVPGLIDCLEHSNASVVNAAVKIVNSISHTDPELVADALGPIVQHVQTRNHLPPLTYYGTAETVRNLEPVASSQLERSVSTLTRALTGESVDEFIRSDAPEAMQSLSLISDTNPEYLHPHLETIATYWDFRAPFGRHAAIKAIENVIRTVETDPIPKVVIKAIESALTDDDEDVRRTACNTVEARPEAFDREPLKELAETDPNEDVREAAQEALAAMTDTEEASRPESGSMAGTTESHELFLESVSDASDQRTISLDSTDIPTIVYSSVREDDRDEGSTLAVVGLMNGEEPEEWRLADAVAAPKVDPDHGPTTDQGAGDGPAADRNAEDRSESDPESVSAESGDEPRTAESDRKEDGEIIREEVEDYLSQRRVEMFEDHADYGSLPDTLIDDITSATDAEAFQLGCNLNLNAAAIGLGLEQCAYDPESFPGMFYQPDSDSAQSNQTLVIFGSGEGVCFADSAEAIEEGIATLRDGLGEIGLLDEPSPPEETPNRARNVADTPSVSVPDSIPTPPNVAVDHAQLTDEQVIGHGGNADVVRVTHPTSDGEVQLALKRPRVGGTLHMETVDRLLEEAETWDKLDDHDHIVGVVDWGTERGLPWIAMEYMDGGHLGERAGELNHPQALWTAIGITKGVRHAHRRGVAHLDLKPENILFRTVEKAWDVPKVADWGLSKRLLDHSKTVDGMSPEYAAPEQFDEAHAPTDDITDIYQLGAVIYDLFAGQPPFEGSPMNVMRSVMDEEPTPPSEIADVPEDIDEVLLTALSKERGDRYDNTAYLRDALEEILHEY